MELRSKEHDLAVAADGDAVIVMCDTAAAEDAIKPRAAPPSKPCSQRDLDAREARRIDCFGRRHLTLVGSNPLFRPWVVVEEGGASSGDGGNGSASQSLLTDLRVQDRPTGASCSSSSALPGPTCRRSRSRARRHVARASWRWRIRLAAALDEHAELSHN